MNSLAHALPRIPKYELKEEVGHGGMATVYRAHDARLQRDVAVKVIHRHLRESAEVGRRFTAEARAVAKLRHRNIVEIYDVSEDDAPERYLVAELVHGGSLRKVLNQHGSFPAEIGACVGIAIAEALAHAHERGVVHRDVKPENVLFSLPSDRPSGPSPSREGEVPTPRPSSGEPEGVEVKITDFGIAKMLDQQGVTATGQVLGSPAYMSPEQIECGDVDARSDVFALGVVLYECMVGHLPFEGKNPAQVLRRVLEGEYPPADQELPTIGAVWSALLNRTLAHDAALRFGSMTELRDALAAELKNLGLGDAYAELNDYFADPTDYSERLAAKMVPRLLARGEVATREGDVVAAAGHYNRALAFAPHDAAVLALVSGMSRRRARNKALVRLGIGAAALAIVGGSAVLTAKVLQKQGTGPATSATAVITADSALAPKVSPSASAPPTTSASARVVTSVAPPLVTHATPPVAPGSATASPVMGERLVKFVVHPKSALLSIDGAPPVDVFGLERTLSLGKHAFKATVREENECCRDTPGQFEALPGDAPQVVRITMSFKSSTLVSKGPAGGSIDCGRFNVRGPANQTFPGIPMKDLTDRGTCRLIEDSQEVGRREVELAAGKTVEVIWPAR